MSGLRIITDRHDPASRTRIAEALEAQFVVASSTWRVQTISQARASSDMLFQIVIMLLMSMASCCRGRRHRLAAP